MSLAAALAICSTDSSLILFFLFFQAEDCIRYFHVTGVQTCALPIVHGPGLELPRDLAPRGGVAADHERSEERRVGKECRSRWSPDHYKKKKQKKQERHAVHPVADRAESPARTHPGR